MASLESETSRIGKRGVVVIPARMRRRFGLEEGSLVIAEETEDGILLRPAITLPVEVYTPERRAEFLLSNAVMKPSTKRRSEKYGRWGLTQRFHTTEWSSSGAGLP